ncbi:MAG: SpoIID/LytB domain-containing protein [Candidatus Omnitrophica bacterium]|nr:SpoIID/LytB domain-containing protein [Candidatus Omnitrophota bacterium]
MRRAMLRYLCFLAACAVLLFAAPACAQDREPEQIRVRVINNVDAITLTAESGYKVYDRGDGRLLKEGGALYGAKVAAAPQGLMLGDLPIAAEGIRIKTNKDGRIYADKWRFRGELEIFKNKESKLVVVNNLDIESYLYGVLYHEVSHYWPYEVLKAQAIAARSFALYQKKAMKDKDYDVTADIYSQVYGGRTAEKYRTNRAVDMTRGKILEFNNDCLPAYYHATCGGFTEDAGNLWKIDLAPLKGVECKFCRRSKHFHWIKKIGIADIEETLNKAGYAASGITQIKIDGRNRSNRINNLIIQGNGQEVKIPGKDFRILIGPNLLKSNNYNVWLSGNTAVFKGTGWGHGVGMCQWGAYFMAKKGYKAAQILQYYYPGAEIK